MAFRRPLPTSLALIFALAACVLLAASLPAAADAAVHCKRTALRVSKHRVKSGSWVRVRGHACGRHRRVRIRVRRGAHWRTAGRARTRGNGSFSGRVRLSARSRQVVGMRAISRAWQSKTVRLHVIPIACALDNPGLAVGMTLPGCTLVASDTASKPDPRSFWGDVACGTTWTAPPDLNRQHNVTTGGDPHPSATGTAQGNDAYRSLTVFDGDDFSGERCELGRNDHNTGPTTFYHEDQHRVTYMSFKLPPNFPLDAYAWQDVMQMKQAQPSDAGGGVPVLFMGAFDNQWSIDSYNGVYWKFPAQAGVWTRFAFDVNYSQDPNKGWLQVSVDLNGDGDFDDDNERSPVIHTNTLKPETDGPNGTSDGLAPGDSIPSHLRAGIYHNDSISCPPPDGCSVDVDNVQVLAP